MTNSTKRVSASKLSTWMTCPLQAKFRYIDKLPGVQNSAATYGSCIHHALSIYNHTGDIDDAIKIFLDVWRNPAKIDAAPTEWSKGYAYTTMKAKGCAVLRAYHDKIKWERREVLATEHEFEVPFGEFTMHGFVDLVELKKNGQGQEEVRITDYKTSKKQPYASRLALDIQFTAYTYAAEQPEFWQGNLSEYWERVKDLPVRAFWYHLNGPKEMIVPARKDADYMRLYRACVEMQKAYDREVYVPNISGDSCVFCPYQEPCGLPIPEAGDDDESD